MTVRIPVAIVTLNCLSIYLFIYFSLLTELYFYCVIDFHQVIAKWNNRQRYGDHGYSPWLSSMNPIMLMKGKKHVSYVCCRILSKKNTDNTGRLQNHLCKNVDIMSLMEHLVVRCFFIVFWQWTKN